MKLVVATLLLAVVVGAFKVAVEKVAPEGLASASTSPHGQAETDVRADGLVRSVRFSLARGSLRAATLADVIDTRAGEPLSAARLEADRERLQQWLVARGHLDAVVEVPTVRVGGDGAAAVEFAVDTGPLYVVRAVVLRGRHADHPGLAAVATLRPGNDAIAERIDGNVELLRDWLAHRGVTATVTARMEPDGFTGEVDVIYTID